MKIKLLIAYFTIATVANAQFTKLFDFTGSANGKIPKGDLFYDGTFLYGMSLYGGTNDLGALFKIMPDGSGYVKLLDFAGTTNGSYPHGSLITDGTFLYGMTRNGGVNGAGTIFKIMPDGSGYVKLYEFSGGTDGSSPSGSLISDGTFLYGMTEGGGTNGIGAVFKIMPNGNGYVKLLDFVGAANGSYPNGSLISDGTFLYGMTRLGGINDMGVIFKIMPDGTGYSKLLDFAGGTNGRDPYGSLISDGTFLYGMTTNGGTSNLGTIFKIMSDGTGYSKLLDFVSIINGITPFGSLFSDGTFLYGMTYGDTFNYGTIFKIKPDGTGLVNLLAFGGGSISAGHAYGSLISDGTFLYGMTSQGGPSDFGSIFKFCPQAFTVQNPTICEGQSVTVGTNTYTASGTYTDTLTAINTCDSIVTTNLTVNPMPGLTTSLNGIVITAIQNGGTYQWIDCSDSSAISGATNQNYTASANGNYAVIVTLNNCSDTSLCTNVSAVGIDETLNSNQLTIYPNPFSTHTVLQTDNLLTNATLTVDNCFGQTVTQIKNISGQTVVLSRDDLANGLYFVRLTQDNNVIAIEKIIILDK